MKASDHRALLRVLSSRRSGDGSPLDLRDVDLSGASLTGADLVNVDLSGADLSGASLAGARLMNVKLVGAWLAGCRLDGSDLTHADLQDVDLSGASLDDCLLVGADLRGASLDGALGVPLSVAGARIDGVTIERSRFNERGVARLIRRGVAIEGEDAVPASIRETLSSDDDIVERLRVQEVEARRQMAEDELAAPMSSRPLPRLELASDTGTAGGEIAALTDDENEPDADCIIDDAPLSATPLDLANLGGELLASGSAFESEFSRQPHQVVSSALSPRAVLPRLSAATLVDETRPEVGEFRLGVELVEDLSSSSVCDTFLGRDALGRQVVYKSFNPECVGAPLHLPAFQRGLRALNLVKTEATDDARRGHATELLAVSTDMTAFVTPYYENGTLENLVSVDITLDAAMTLFEQICESFAYLHAHGLLVRSVKPAKILIDGLEPVLGEVDMVDLPTLAAASPDALGYGPYAAPEELAGVGTRSPTACVYALGRLLEYLVVGETPTTPLSTKPKLASHIPRGIGELICRCIQAEPLDRLQYVEDVLEFVRLVRREGQAIVLESWVRPGDLSHANPPLMVRPSMQAPPRAASVRPSRAASVKSMHPAQPIKPSAVEKDGTGWIWGPAFERWVALLASMLVLGAVGLLLAVPHMEGLRQISWVLYPAIGLTAWWIPRPARWVRMFRITTALAVGLLASEVQPQQIAALRWQQQLVFGGEFERARAVRFLVRSGERGFASANLQRLDLSGEDLSISDFRDASLLEANLSESILLDSKLMGADLRSANLEGADLRNTDLDKSKNLETARCNRWTRLPAEVVCSGEYLALRNGRME